VRWQQFNSLLRLTGHELLRTRWLWLQGGVLVLAGALASFAAALAPTDGAAHRIAFYAATARFGLLVSFCLPIIVHTVRDAEQGWLQMLLSRALARPALLLARHAGHTAAGIAMALVACLPLCALATPGAALAWGFALACELVLMGAVALTAAISLRHVTLAFCAVLAFYALGRSIATISTLAHDPLRTGSSALNEWVARGVDGLGLLVPDLARHAETAWLLYGGIDAVALAGIAAQSVLYAALALTVGCIDFARRNF
jgi:hypothetical protein